MSSPQVQGSDNRFTGGPKPEGTLLTLLIAFISVLTDNVLLVADRAGVANLTPLGSLRFHSARHSWWNSKVATENYNHSIIMKGKPAQMFERPGIIYL